MPRIVKPLTDTEIKKSKSKDKIYYLSDGDGLRLKINTLGHKQWQFRFISPITKKQRKTSFGSYPKISLKLARERRNEFIEFITKGIDPIDHNKKLDLEKKKDNLLSKELTVSKLLEKYIDLKQHNNNLSDRTISDYRSRIKNHFYPYLPFKEDTPIKSLTSDILINCLEKLEIENKLETLKRIRGIILEFLKFLYSEDLLSDPIIITKLELKNFKKNSKNKIRNLPAILKEKDIKKLYNKCLDYNRRDIARHAILFSFHTAQRQGNIINALWSEFDFEEKLWRIPKEKMKVKRDHILPLSKEVIEILQKIKDLDYNSIYVFASPDNNLKHISKDTVNNALRHMNYSKDEIVAHGFRTIFSTICNNKISDHNINYEFIEKALAHSSNNQVREIYNRAENIQELRTLMQWWSNYLIKLKY